jgi:phage terminase small subunit
LFSASAGPDFLKMPVLTSSKHEKFAQLVASGVNATKAYVSAGYSKVAAAQNAHRLITNDDL